MCKVRSKAGARLAILFALALTAALPVAAWAAPTPAQKCEAGKNDVAGKYAACLGKAEKGLVNSGDMAKYTAALGKCDGKYSNKWGSLETAAGPGVCPSEGDASDVAVFVDSCAQGVAAEVGGGSLPPPAPLLKTGVTKCYDPTGAEIACAGTGQDGELLKGTARSFTDNGDGTITDDKTGLMWEKLSDDGTIHDKDDFYTWANAFASKVATLNTAIFAGYSDWRVPNEFELYSLASLGKPGLSIYSAFDTGCAPACTVLTCSCTPLGFQWSSSTFHFNPQNAWIVYFQDGKTDFSLKTSTHTVRAVRAGP